VSPLSLRRYRAERLLRQEFQGLRGRVLATVRGRLRASGVSLDAGDLDACYAQAWQGLYAAVLDGEEIVNPAGWLVVVTFRRAIEEHRASGRVHGDWRLRDSGQRKNGAGAPQVRVLDARVCDGERDLAVDLDDRTRLRHLFEALRVRLGPREREAAALCYLQGLSRSEAAARMGISEARMRKLMDGHGPARPGVAGKMGALVETIREGAWCEEQGSLMRGLAYGILDPDGERYRLAMIHVLSRENDNHRNDRAKAPQG
jgi:RNA polymerase sigma factor (sigma-70 family)